MKKIFVMAALMMSAVCSADRGELIYQPKVLMPEVPDEIAVEDLNWRLSGFIGQVLPSNLDSTDQVGASLSYLVSNRWYAATELWYSKWGGHRVASFEVTKIGVGLGYDLFQGAAYIAKGLTLPWTMYGQISAGNQYVDDDSGTYYSGALGWRLAKDNYYAGLEWRRFSVDDQRLQQLKTDKGYQWAIQLGRYF